MKPGKPMKRSPLKRGTSQLKRSPLKKRSDKMNEMYKDRRVIVERYLKETPKCTACVIFYAYDVIKSTPLHERIKFGVVHQRKTVDVHEIVNRSQGGSILNDINLIAVCRLCHTRITTNPTEAEIVGLHLNSWCNAEKYFEEAFRVRQAWMSGVATQPYWLDGKDE